MKNHKGMAIICWVISVIAFLSAVLMGVGELLKSAIFIFVLGILWLVAGIIHWKKKEAKEE